MRVSTLLPIAIAASLVEGAPIGLLKGHLNKRDHALLQKRGQVLISSITDEEPTPTTLSLEKRQDVVTVHVPDPSPDVVVVTEVSIVTASPDNNQPADPAPADPSPQEDGGNVVTVVVTAGAEPDTAQAAQPTTPPPADPTPDTPAPAPSPDTTTPPAPAPPSTTDDNTPSTTTDSPPSSSTSDSTSSPTGTGSVSGIPNTITYSPYNDDSSCKDAGTVMSDLSMLSGKGVKAVRIYGTDCNSIQTVQPACQQLGLKIDQGFWIGPAGVDSIDDGVQSLISWVQQNNNNDWSIFQTITVGNEAVYGGYIDAATLLGKIKSVKSTLRSAGWGGSVTTAEPPQTYLGYTDLCTDTDGVDYIGVNAHPYFDPSSSPETAGDFVLTQLSTVQGACNNRPAQITETGYPSAGNTNGNNVPNKENQATAIANIMKALNNGGVMFTTFNDAWKAPGPYNVEQHFGIIDLF